MGALQDLRGDGRGWVLLVIAAGWFLVLGARVVLPTLLPQVRVTFGISNATAGFVLTVLWVCYAFMQFPSGLLADRAGERTIMVVSVLASIVGVTLFATAPTFGLFLFASVVFGLGSGLYATPRVTKLGRVFPDRNNAALGVTFASGNVGAASLPVVAGFLAVWFGWRVGFGVVVPALALVAVGLWWHVPARSDAGDADAAGGTADDDVAGGGTADENVGATEGAAGRTDDGARDAAGPAGADASPRAVARRLGDVATHPTFLMSLIAMSLGLFVYQAITAFLPTYLVEEKGLSQTTASTIYGLFFASGALSQYALGDVADRFGQVPVLVGVAGFGALTLVALVFVGGAVPLAAAVVLLGTRLGLGSVGNAYVADVLPADVQGSGYGLFRTFFVAVGSLGSLFVGVLASRGLFDESFLALAAITGVAALLFTRLPPADEPEYDSPAVGASGAVAPGDDAGADRDDATD